MTQSLTLHIEGVQCEGCAERLEGLLGRASGVRSVVVDSTRGNAELRYNARIIDPTGLIEIVERGGFRVSASE